MSIEDEIAGQLLGSIEAERHLDRFAHQIAEEIRDLTPIFGDHPPKRDEPGIGEPGDLKASIHVNPIARPGRRRIESDDPKVFWAEMGAKHFPEVGMFARVAALHGGSGPDFAEAVEHAQSNYRREAQKLEKLVAEGNPGSIAAQRVALERARLQRSAAFKASRSRGGGRRRSR